LGKARKRLDIQKTTGHIFHYGSCLREEDAKKLKLDMNRHYWSGYTVVKAIIYKNA